jgi:hypothetical protein
MQQSFGRIDKFGVRHVKLIKQVPDPKERSMADIATKKVFENDKDGKSCGALTMEPDFTMFFHLEGKELVAGDFRIPLTHSARNIGNTRFREILVESK